MIESSVAQPKGSHPRTNTVVGRIEREIARLKAARPRLATRVERAEHILVTQLSCSNRSRPLKVRVHADGSRSFAVRSGSKLRKVYTVKGSGFRCGCPDAHRKAGSRRHSACKHGIACYILERALRRLSGTGNSGGGCSGCSASGVELFEVADSLTFFEGDLVCRECAADTASETA
ncbi:MAG: hypothetical protein H0U65_12455 [Rubrobacter sp.]|nr:hypothetical protein [Rubrobacter sp.]